MTITEIGILFTRGVNLHNQLRFISKHDDIHKPLLSKLKKICDAEDSQESRSDLQSFIVEHGSMIYREYSKHLDSEYNYSI